MLMGRDRPEMDAATIPNRLDVQKHQAPGLTRRRQNNSECPAIAPCRESASDLPGLSILPLARFGLALCLMTLEDGMRSEEYRQDKQRPFMGAEYLASLRDGRQVFINGERVADVTQHLAMRNSAGSIARLYDALHAESTHAVPMCPTDTGSGGYTNKYFRLARSSAELVEQQAAISNAMAHNSQSWTNETVLPNIEAALSYRTFMSSAYPRVIEIVRRVVASGLIYLPSSARDLANPEIDRYLAQYVRGSNDIATSSGSRS
jgi:aromatic ring hydroxylase